jgi:metal-sulfur cluster biosynthetic enzyme
MQNQNPTINFSLGPQRLSSPEDLDDSIEDQIDALEVFDHIRNINDPEHPLTLEQLNVVCLDQISIENKPNSKVEIHVQFKPTIPHCSMATMIGLSLVVKLKRSFSLTTKIRVTIFPGTHQNEHAINRQLNDKERVAAAMENKALLSAINSALTIKH